MNLRNRTRRCCLGVLGIVVAACWLAGCHAGASPAESLTRRPFSIVVLPDTQNYTDSSFGGSPKYFYDQTRWIRENKDKLNIVMTAHVGDIVQNPKSTSEWKIAARAMKTIDDAVPYILCLGNHDIFDGPDKEGGVRRTLVNDYFSPSRFTENRLYTGNFEADKSRHFLEPGKLDNYYLLFTGGGMKFLIVSLEFKPRDKVLAWAGEVVAAHPDHRCIVLTHGYLDARARRNMGRYAMKGNDAPKIWEKLVSRHKNIFMVLCGHMIGESVLTSKGQAGNQVHQVLANYQNNYVGNGGRGYLRIMTFHPDKKKIESRTYSPSVGAYLTKPKSRFTLEYE